MPNWGNTWGTLWGPDLPVVDADEAPRSGRDLGLLEPEQEPFQEVVRHFQPAFLAYEKALVSWLRLGMRVPRGDRTVQPRIEYAGGERAIQAVRALKVEEGGSGQARNMRFKTPVVTIKMNDLEYLPDRYHPPESEYFRVYNTENREQATRVARVPKPAPYRIFYSVDIYCAYESDLRYIMFTTLPKFHVHGGVAYLAFASPKDHKDIRLFPFWLRGFSNQTDSNTGQEERTVRASMMIEMEAYLPLPYKFVPVFKKFTAVTEVTEPVKSSVLDSFFPDRPPGAEDELVCIAGDPSRITIIQPSALPVVPSGVSTDPDTAAQEKADQFSIVLKVDPDD